jgi:hypothetical protein
VPGDIGVPGLTKTYRVIIINKGRLPVMICKCDWMDDSMERGQELLSSVERWNRSTKKWQKVWAIPRNQFCKGNRFLDANLARKWLLPGAEVVAIQIAIQDLDGLRLGDTLGFIVQPLLSRPNSILRSRPFNVDERPRR